MGCDMTCIQILTIITSGYYICHIEFTAQCVQHGARVGAEEGQHTRRLLFEEGIPQNLEWRLRGFGLPCGCFEGGRRTYIYWSRDVGSYCQAAQGCCHATGDNGLQSRRRQRRPGKQSRPANICLMSEAQLFVSPVSFSKSTLGSTRPSATQTSTYNRRCS